MMSPLGNLATLQAKAGHLEAALETIAEYRALAATLSPDEPRGLYTQLTESRVWRLTGHCDRAIPLQREAWARFSAAHGADHPLTTNVMGELGHCLAETHDPKQADPAARARAPQPALRDDAVIPDAAFALAKIVAGRCPASASALARRGGARALASRRLERAGQRSRGLARGASALTGHRRIPPGP